MNRIKTLVMSGGRNHDFVASGKAVMNILSASDTVAVTMASDPRELGPANPAKYDFRVFNTRDLKIDKAQQKALLSVG